MARNVVPIQTVYKGYRFRSRLEARWAVYFDSIGLLWRYEDQGYMLGDTPYLPDFFLPQVEMFAEVKPDSDSFDFDKILKLVHYTGKKCLLLDGVPTCKPYVYIEHGDDGTCDFTDCAVSMYHEYPVTERRFYSSVEDKDEDSFRHQFPDTLAAVNRARSARFEFGESP